jgi:cytochrome P450
VLITSHHLAEQLSKSTKEQPYSTTKSPTVLENFRSIIGEHSLLSENGESWKSHRKRFNPGFAPQHILSLLPIIIDKTYKFIEKLDALATSGVATQLEPYCTNVTFDIVSAGV